MNPDEAYKQDARNFLDDGIEDPDQREVNSEPCHTWLLWRHVADAHPTGSPPNRFARQCAAAADRAEDRRVRHLWEPKP